MATQKYLRYRYARYRATQNNCDIDTPDMGLPAHIGRYDIDMAISVLNAVVRAVEGVLYENNPNAITLWLSQRFH